MALNLNCPSCSSDATQRLSVVYEHGLSDINTSSSTAGVGFGGGGIGVGAAKTKTKGIAQTAMSQKASPPSKKKLFKPIGIILLVFLGLSIATSGQGKFVSGFITILWMAGSVGWAVFAIHYNTSKWPPLKAIWDDSFLCNRCNHMFHAQNI